MIEHEKLKVYGLDEWVDEFDAIYYPVNEVRNPSGIWLYVVEHAAAIHESLRLADYIGVRNQLPRIFCWLCAFVNSASKSSKLAIQDSFLEIVLSKHPTQCFYCAQPKCLCQSSFGAGIEDIQDKRKLKERRRVEARRKRAELGQAAPRSLPELTYMFRDIFGHKNFDSPLEIIAAHFQEEIGEVSEDINQMYDQILLGNELPDRHVTREDLEEELADVFTWLVALYWKTDYILGGAKRYFLKEELSETQWKIPSLQEGLEELIWNVYVDVETSTHMVDPRTQSRPVPSPLTAHPENM